MVSPDVLFSPRLKVQRANRHIDELIDLTTPLSRDLYTLRIERDVGPTPDNAMPFGLVYRPTQPIPETLALIIGDTLHNLRSALDHLATGIARTIKDGAQVHFPMRQDREDLVTPDARLRPTLDLIEQALPGTVDLLLNEIRPKDGPLDALWSFHTIENDDKHNLLVRTVTAAGVTNINFRIGNTVERDASMRFNAATPYHLIGGNRPIAIEQNFQTAVEVGFGPASPFEHEPVIPTLTNIAKIVTETINAFERLINR